ncbi:MAG: D-alanyl-D-alanine carboxypeptidase/D-alanyl-D-alanine-endopeptidase [Chlorobi bacterium]|nr:D-alanyl-D-alanine carboxypeptidase/D-alanyl-D-alanine-endopeptidase [Chlorobiota bacterium]
MKKNITLIFILLLQTIFIAQDLSSLNKLVDKYQSSKLFKNSIWALHARYLDSGKIILDENSEVSVAPASNMKLFTTSAALEILGEDYKFSTKIYYDGSIDNSGNLKGNIYIVGGGDPTLGYDLVKGSLPLDELMDTWVKAISEKGIKTIRGNVIADALLYDAKPIPDMWDWIDIGNYYGASSTALTINNNLYFLYFKPAANVGETAEVLRMKPEIPGLTFTNYMKTGKKGSGDNGYIYCAPLQYNATLRGTIPAGSKEFSIKGSIPDPPLFAAQKLISALKKSNISVKGKAIKLLDLQIYDDSKLITETISPPLKDIVYIVNKRSDNLYTEMLLKALALNAKGKGDIESGTEAVKEYLEKNGINTDGLIMYDGCGLSRSDAITAKMMVDLLEMLTKKKHFDSFFNSLAVVGDPGDIGYFSSMGRGTEIEKNAHIKSGVISGVRAYSGYLKDKKGRTIIFSLIANNFNGEGSDVSFVHKKIMIELAKLN